MVQTTMFRHKSDILKEILLKSQLNPLGERKIMFDGLVIIHHDLFRNTFCSNLYVL